MQGKPCQWWSCSIDSDNARRCKEVHWELWGVVDLFGWVWVGEIRESKRLWDKESTDRYLGIKGDASRWGKQLKMSSRSHWNWAADDQSTAVDRLAWW